MEATYKLIKVGDETFLKLNQTSVNIKHIESITDLYLDDCYRIKTRGNEFVRVCMNNNAANYNFIKELFFKEKDV